jgi:hypothetical protein
MLLHPALLFRYAAPLLLTGVQFFFQHILARLVLATGLIKRTGSAFTWREWGKLGAQAVDGLTQGIAAATACAPAQQLRHVRLHSSSGMCVCTAAAACACAQQQRLSPDAAAVYQQEV